MTTSFDFASPVRLKAVSAPDQPVVTPPPEDGLLRASTEDGAQ
jgi:hypothetical protein